MKFDLNYDDENFLDLMIAPEMRENPDTLHDYAGRLKIRNPALDFAEMAKAGRFNDMSDEDYEIALRRIKTVSSFFSNKPDANIFHILAESIKYILATDNGH
ncbi:MAG: hypothetical protein K6F53_04035 [Lachnospiraceae bacterium]|nr:hypothetical protein [Lachnospiraceae bacterium]